MISCRAANAKASKSGRKDVYLSFFVDDWRSSADLKSCSLAARAVWLECLLIMHRHSPDRGRLLRGSGEPMSAAALARDIGCTEAEAEAALTELLAEGVCSRDETGAICCRRMVRENELAKARSAAGAAGAEARWDGKVYGKPDGKTIANAGTGDGDGDGSDLNSSLKGESEGESEGESRQSTPPVLPAPAPLTEALALVRCALAAWEAEGLPVVTDYVDADRAGRFAQAVEYVARRHGRTPEDIVLSAVAAAGASPWCRGLTAANPDPVDSGWLVAPMKALKRGTRPLTPGEHITRIEKLLHGGYARDHARDHAAERQAAKPKHPVLIARDKALAAAEQAPMWPDDDPGGPRSGALWASGDERERRARWVRGGET